MINQKGFKKSLMHAYISRLYITLSCTLLYSLLIFFKCKVPSENERYRNCKGHWAECLLFSQWRKYYRSLILAAKRKREDSHWSKITHAFLRNEKTKISQLNEKRSSIPWRLRMPIWKIIFCSTVLRLSELPTCRERPQTAICCLEWLGRLNCLATGLDASGSFLSTSRRCSRNRSPNRLPVSPMYNFLQ